MGNSSISILAALAVLAAVAGSGCAPLPPEHAVDWRNGAKRGWVAAVYDTATPRAQLPRCLAQLPDDELSAHRYVRIDYHHARRMLTEVAALPDDAPVPLGARVELWPQDCDKGHLSRIARILPSA